MIKNDNNEEDEDNVHDTHNKKLKSLISMKTLFNQKNNLDLQKIDLLKKTNRR